MRDRNSHTLGCLDLLKQLRVVLTRAAKRKLVLASVGSVLTALLDTAGVALVLPLAATATGSAGSSSISGVVRSLLGNPSPGDLTVILAVAVVALFVLKDAASLAFLWWLNGFTQLERVETTARLLHRMLSAPYAVSSRRSSAEMMRTADSAVTQVFTYTINGLMMTVSSGFSIVTIIAALAIVAPSATLGLVIYFSIAAAAFHRIARPKASAAGAVMTEAYLQGYKTALGALSALKEIALRRDQTFFVSRYREAQLEGARASRLANFIGGLPRYLLEVLFIIAIGLVVLIGSGSGSGGKGTIGLLALFVAAGFRLLPAISALLGNLANIRVGAESLRLVYAEQFAEPLVEVGGGALLGASASTTTGGIAEPKRMCSELKLEHVSFRYPSGHVNALTDVDLTVPRGAILAVTGGSGAGKTTLVDVMLGLYRPTEGRIMVDNRDIRENIAGWQNQLGYVAQDVVLLDTSLAENVAFDEAAEVIDRDRIWSALEQAQLADFVRGLPDGLNTPLGERGARMSGGQRQRVGIARALYRNCSVLFLDEATSALDNETESRVTRALAGLHGNVTTIVVAHRLSTVQHADQIAFLKGGKLEGAGSFEDLRRISLDFERLVQLGTLDPGASR